MVNRELICPQSIVVVGGSNNVHKPGGRLVRNLLDGKYKGSLYVVNAKETDVQGLKSYHSVQDIPETEMAILSIPSKACVEVVDVLAHQKNVKAFIIISAGFGEEELPDECLEVKSIDILASMAKGISKKILTAAEVKGDSMIEANIYPGDIVIFARGRVEGDGIYVLALGGEVLVKRLQFDSLSNELEIISMNKNYKPRTVAADADGLRILGKVVGWFHNEI